MAFSTAESAEHGSQSTDLRLVEIVYSLDALALAHFAEDALDAIDKPFSSLAIIDLGTSAAKRVEVLALGGLAAGLDVLPAQAGAREGIVTEHVLRVAPRSDANPSERSGPRRSLTGGCRTP